MPPYQPKWLPEVGRRDINKVEALKGGITTSKGDIHNTSEKKSGKKILEMKRQAVQLLSAACSTET